MTKEKTESSSGRGLPVGAPLLPRGIAHHARRIAAVLRTILGVLLINAALIPIVHHVYLPQPNPAAGQLLRAFEDTGLMYLSKIIELIVGILLLCNVFAPLMVVVILPIVIMVCWVDYVLDIYPGALVMCTILTSCTIGLLLLYLDQYRTMLARQPMFEAARTSHRNEIVAATGVLAAFGLFGVLIFNDVRSSRPSSPATGSPIQIGQIGDLRGEGKVARRVFEAYVATINERGGVNGHPVEVVTVDTGTQGANVAAAMQSLVTGKDVRAIVQLGSSTRPEINSRYADLTQTPYFRIGGRMAYDQDGKWTTSYLPNLSTELSMLVQIARRASPVRRVTVISSHDLADAGFDKDVSIVRVAGDTLHSTAVLPDLLAAQRQGGTLILAMPPVPAAALLTAHGWKGPRVLSSEAAPALNKLSAAQRRNMTGIYSIRYFKDPSDPAWSTLQPMRMALFPRWDNDADAQAYGTFVRQRLPDLDPKSSDVIEAYSLTRMVIELLERSKGDFSKGNLLWHARHSSGAAAPLLTPSVTIQTTQNITELVSKGQPIIFDGTNWTERGSIVDALAEPASRYATRETR